MEAHTDIVIVALTKDEAQELFNRCLKSHDDDNAASVAILRKLAHLLETPDCPELRVS